MKYSHHQTKIHWEVGRAKDLSVPRYIRDSLFEAWVQECKILEENMISVKELVSNVSGVL
jgi:hypothetical protein